MPFGLHLDARAPRAALRSALIGGAAAMALAAAPPFAQAQRSAQNPGQNAPADKNITAQVQKEPLVALPSLAPLVQKVVPAVVSISARLNGDAATQADQSADERDQSSPFDDLLRQAVALVAAIERVGQRAIVLTVFGKIGVQ